MKIPQKPVSWGDLVKKYIADPERYMSILRQVPRSTYKGRYIHWDRLRYRPEEPPLTHEERWFGLRHRRNAVSKSLPLRDRDGLAFTYGMVDPVVEMLHFIDQNAAGRIEMPDPVTNPHTRDRYIVSSLIEEAIRSSQLEGAATTREVAKQMIKSGRSPTDTHEQMILNNYRTMLHVRELKDKPLDIEMICRIQAMITEDTLERPETAGRFRLSDEEVGVYDERDGTLLYNPPPADELAARAQFMCRFANGEIPDDFLHPVLRAVILHFWLAYDHPFVDGNGRTARALFYWLMLKQEYWVCEFISISRILREAPARYARSFLYTETDDNDLNYFVIHQLEVIKRAIIELYEYVKRKTGEIQALEAKSRLLSELNHRQKALIMHALHKPNASCTIHSHQNSHNIVYETSRRDLMDLTERGLLTVYKVGREQHFRPARDLEKLLADGGIG